MHKSKITVQNTNSDTLGKQTREDTNRIDIGWVDEFVTKIKPYVFVRELDNLLILIPNQAYRLNHSAVTMLDFLVKGHTINEFMETVGDTAARRREVHYFFCDLRAAVSGCLRDDEKREAVAYYEYNGDINEYPVLSEIAVTYRCNLHCGFCYVGEHGGPELNTSDVKKILYKILNEARVPSVSFTGGEPLMRKDIGTLISYASSIGLWTNLITNGTLIDTTCADVLRKAGLSSAQVSLEGPNESVHDGITGVRGSFNKTLQGVEHLQHAGIPVHTNTTVCRSNIQHLEDIVRLVKTLGLKRLSMNLLIPCGSGLTNTSLWVSYSEIGDTILSLKRRASEEGVKFLWYSPVPMCHFNPIANGLGNKSCAAITGLLSIDPMGNVIPCSSWRSPVGSLLKKPFKYIWESAALAYFKNTEYAPEQCRSCVQRDVCKGACPLYWSARGCKELYGRA
jgi:radical SAM protein with 4Fe4S-binding SPASM domain